MKKTRYTPGPWNHQSGSQDGLFEINSEVGWKAVADCSRNNQGARNVELDEAEANAKLISAAPELLAIVERLQWSEWNRHTGNWCCPECFAKPPTYEDYRGHGAGCSIGKAISKATGEKS